MTYLDVSYRLFCHLLHVPVSDPFEVLKQHNYSENLAFNFDSIDMLHIALLTVQIYGKSLLVPLKRLREHLTERQQRKSPHLLLSETVILIFRFLFIHICKC